MVGKARKRGCSLVEALEFYTLPEPMSGCWLWTGSGSDDGYGSLQWKGQRRIAHRLAYEAATGVAPGDKMVCHKCDVRCCVNPDHLFLGSAADNSRDMVAKGRSIAMSGEAHHLNTLTTDEVEQIRNEYVKGSREFGTYALARKYNTTQANIWFIISGRTWKHLKAA